MAGLMSRPISREKGGRVSFGRRALVCCLSRLFPLPAKVVVVTLFPACREFGPDGVRDKLLGGRGAQLCGAWAGKSWQGGWSQRD